MKVIIAGATGMVGSEVLKQCLKSDKVSEVVSLVRKASHLDIPKLTELVLSDFTDYSKYADAFKNLSAAYFCIGVYTGQVSDEEFKRITVDYAVKFAEALKQYSPDVKFCMLSGAGADKSGKRRTAFARYKGMAENQIENMGIEFYSFRPGYIYPVEKRKEPNVMYSITRLLYPVIKLLGKNASIKSTELGAAIFSVGLQGAEKGILENRDILALV